MPHQCVRCNTLYPDGAQEILKGCSCGARLFFYIKKKKLEESKKIIEELTDDEKKHIEQDVTEILHVKQEQDSPVVLDIESVNMLRSGQYELDLVKLFKKDPLVFKLEEGKYVIDLPQVFKEEREKEQKNN